MAIASVQTSRGMVTGATGRKIRTFSDPGRRKPDAWLSIHVPKDGAVGGDVESWIQSLVPEGDDIDDLASPGFLVNRSDLGSRSRLFDYFFHGQRQITEVHSGTATLQNGNF